MSDSIRAECEMADELHLKLLAPVEPEPTEDEGEASPRGLPDPDAKAHVIATAAHRIIVRTEGPHSTFSVARADDSSPVVHVGRDPRVGYTFTVYDSGGGRPKSYLRYEDFERGARRLLERVERERQGLRREKEQLEELDADLFDQALEGAIRSSVLEGKIADLKGQLESVSEEEGEQKFRASQRAHLIETILEYLHIAAGESFDVSEVPRDWKGIEPIMSQLLERIALANEAREADREMDARTCSRSNPSSRRGAATRAPETITGAWMGRTSSRGRRKRSGPATRR